MGNIWIIGNTGSGKSTFARKLSERLNLPIFEAGKFARALCPKGTSVEKITEESAKKLQENHRYFSNLIKQNLTTPSIISGARNPIDFADSFNPKTDYVVFLENHRFVSLFEAYGIEAIKALVTFFYNTDQIKIEQMKILVADKSKEDWYDAAYIEATFVRSCS